MSSIGISLAPFFLFGAPQSGVFNAALALSLSAFLTPLLFSAMKTDTVLEALQDKVTVGCFHVLFALATGWLLARPMEGWLAALFALAFASFLSRAGLWLAAGGSIQRYTLALVLVFLVAFLYMPLVARSCITAETWRDWRVFVAPQGQWLGLEEAFASRPCRH
ncbi:MAG TPA: hypothetical protein VNI54_13240 [Thermoanaerobaculia bacterium]|nr:hypothetical protein [Thermoanaerobaculia bacterium]